MIAELKSQPQKNDRPVGFPAEKITTSTGINMMLTVFYSDHIPLPLPDGHRFPATKYSSLRERVAEFGPEAPVRLLPGPPVTSEELSRVHDADYLRRVFIGELDAHDQRAIGFPWSEGLVERCLTSAGATVAAARFAKGNHWSAHLAGGTHHAFSDHGGGYCIFNDVAVAIRTLQAENSIEKSLVVDCDVHQGDGTATIFSDDNSVFTLSLHGKKNYPLRKTVSDLDVPLPDRTDDLSYEEALRSALREVWACFSPDCVFYIAGADAFEGDRHGRLSLTKAGLQTRDQIVLKACSDRGLGLVTVMGGGYAPEASDIVDIHATTIQLMARTVHGHQGLTSS